MNSSMCMLFLGAHFRRTAKHDSVIALQVFDQRKFKKQKDQGFLGVVNLLMSDIFDLSIGGDGLLEFKLNS
jgi:E3 ubiquitin-protein ligase NEDD4